MEVLIIISFAASMIALMFMIHLVTQMESLQEMLNYLGDKIEADLPESKNSSGFMNLMLLNANKKSKKARRFTDKSKDWLNAHEQESRR